MSAFTPARETVAKFRIAAEAAAKYIGQDIYALIPVEKPGIQTMAVDQYGRLYYDPEFVASIPLPTGVFSVLHETLHIVLDHASMGRRVLGTNPTKAMLAAWNMAADMVVNEILSGFSKDAPEGIITAQRFGMPPKLTAVEYYNLIMQAANNEEQQDDNQPSPTADRDDDSESDESDDAGNGDEDGDGEGVPSESEEESGEDDDSDGDADSQPGEGDDEDESEGDGASAGGDDDAEDGDGGESGSESEGGDSPDDGGDAEPVEGEGGSCADGRSRSYELPPDPAWEDRQYTMTQDRERKCEEIGWGNVPGEIRVALNARLRPQPDPFDMLRACVMRAVASPVGVPEHTYRRLSRRQTEDGIRLKGVRLTTPNAVVVVDTSGSMSDTETKAKCLAVVAQGLRRLRSFKVICGDTRVQSSKHVSACTQVEWSGGGGTSMKRVLEQVDNDDRPDAIVLITDGYTDWPDRLRARLVVAMTTDRPSPAWAKTTLIPAGGASCP